MTRISPEIMPPVCTPLFTRLQEDSSRCQHLVPASSRFGLLNLALLADLLDDPALVPYFRSLLAPEEVAIFSGFRFAKRRQEWLGGRLAAKFCLAQMRSLTAISTRLYRDIPIRTDTSGRPAPNFETPDGHPLALSISHSHGWAVAMTSDSIACGIDIERKTEQLLSVQERFTTEGETALFPGHLDQLTCLALIWTAKEAVKKCRLHDQPTFFGRITVQAISFDPEPALWTAHCRLSGDGAHMAEVHLLDLGDYTIAATRGDHA